MTTLDVSPYYAATAAPTAPLPRLEGVNDCDVCVIGGGITGCSAALHLAERGYDVILLEAERIAWGASGRSGGQVIFGYACEIGRLRRLCGTADARRLWEMSLEAVALVKARIARHAIDCHWRDGQLHVAIKPRQRAELARYREDLGERYGYPLEFLEREALAAHIRSPRYLAGLYDRASGHLHPMRYTQGLAAAARTAGARLFEQSRAVSIERGPRPVVVTAHGRVRARHVVLGANAYLRNLVPELAAKIMPVGTYIIASEPLGAARMADLLPSGAAVTDINFVLDYFRPSADHRLLFGGRVSYTTLPPPNLARSMHARMARVFPDLAHARIDHAWGGFVDISMNRAPHFGCLDDTIFFAHGFSGHGLALTGLAGQLIAEAVAGQAERFDVFARIPHRNFPGGRLLRTPLLLLATAYYRLRDLL